VSGVSPATGDTSTPQSGYTGKNDSVANFLGEFFLLHRTIPMVEFACVTT
jgi:hypothetical protein